MICFFCETFEPVLIEVDADVQLSNPNYWNWMQYTVSVNILRGRNTLTRLYTIVLTDQWYSIFSDGLLKKFCNEGRCFFCCNHARCEFSVIYM